MMVEHMFNFTHVGWYADLMNGYIFGLV